MVVQTTARPKAAPKAKPKAKSPPGDTITHTVSGKAAQARQLTPADRNRLLDWCTTWGIDPQPGTNVITFRLMMPLPPKAAPRRRG